MDMEAFYASVEQRDEPGSRCCPDAFGFVQIATSGSFAPNFRR
jgi:nucleotidyltransferase/DNA polymerase involved in DNA repair